MIPIRRKLRILFLCTGNSCRSQMGEGILRHLGGDAVEVASAGTEPASQVHPLAVAALQARGVDISEHRPKHLVELEGQEFDFLITTCDEADRECPVFAGAKARIHWSLPDPARAVGSDEEIRAFFGQVADDITRRIGEFLRSQA